MSTKRVFLRISQADQTCIFFLDAGEGRSLQRSIHYPASLTNLYHNWRRLYGQFYRNLRGRPGHSGTGDVPPEDLRVKLAQAEVLLLNEFDTWLSDAELLPLRTQLAELAKANGGEPIALFLSCDNIDLERLPWEAWDVGQQFGAAQSIQIIRSPINIRYSAKTLQRQGRLRILAIMGDDTGLDFQHEYEALQALKTTKVADVQFIGWREGIAGEDLKDQITQALIDEGGWDILFFAGHSNETELSQGEIFIAPGQSLLMSELRPFLKQAQQRGLKVAIFNSCSGLNIAEALVDLGLSQVVVMREPIHNQVAQEFFLQLVQALANQQNIHTSLRSACQSLQGRLKFPSTHLVPSLYCHPDAPLFCARPVGVRAKLRQWKPTVWEAVGLMGLVVLSSSLNVQQALIDRRQWVQAIYRDATGQMPTTKPLVLLVQIDSDSIKNNRIEPVWPINKAYIGQLLNKAAEVRAPIVGLDYLLDRAQKEVDQSFSQTTQKLVAQGLPLVVGVDCRGETCQQPLTDLFPSSGVHYGSMGVLLATEGMNRSSIYAPLQNSSQSVLPLAYQLACLGPRIAAHPPASACQRSQRSPDSLTPSPITRLSYGFGQMWLHPLIDYSIDPQRVYQTLPAHQFLERSTTAPDLQDLQQQVLLIAPGLYDEAGVEHKNADRYGTPQAFRYWEPNMDQMPGGNIHAYLAYQWQNQLLIRPIPDFWLVLLAALSTKAFVIYCLNLLKKPYTWIILMVSLNLVIFISLQIYISFQILIPLLLPISTFSMYILLAMLKETGYAKRF
ncbi:CHASE2 domain-containing protein [Alkalinema pantanalense CENA528]|uniref:CHASE2 domain-containing protein n=1 Tax=Alkalinema pantanalense TaxID=1620705 RepID=UPI003D6FAA07